ITHEDFDSVMRFVLDPHILAVSPESRFDDIEDVVEAAKEGETISVAVSGQASPDVLTFQEFAEAAGVKGQLTAVPYDGNAEMIPSVMSGETDLYSGTATSAKGQLESGDLVPLGVAAEERIDLLPDTPTLEELGYDATGGSFFGLAV